MAKVFELYCVSDQRGRHLAKQSVFRWYRPRALSKDHFCNVHGYGKIARFDQLLPLEDEMVEMILEVTAQGYKQSEGRTRNKPAAIWGQYFANEHQAGNTVDDIKDIPPDPPGLPDDPQAIAITTLYTRGWTLDRETGIIKFGDYVYRMLKQDPLQDGQAMILPAPAYLFLRTAFGVREEKTGGPVRYVRERKQKGQLFGTAPLCSFHEDLQLSMGVRAGKLYKNDKELDVQADYYLDAIERQFTASFPGSRKYAGLVWINPDGAIQSVSFEVGPNGAETSASRNSEQSDGATQPYKVRRMLERLASNQRKPALTPAQRRAAAKKETVT